MNPKGFAAQLHAIEEFFDRSTRPLTEKDSGYKPKEELFTVAEIVAHVAQTIDWFVEGAFRPDGFSMDFEAMEKEIRAVKSLDHAREWFHRAIAKAVKATEEKSAAEWAKPLPEGPIMGGMPRFLIFGSISDHTAHHRGALTVYQRLLGLVPPMPYMDM
jgi:uncharacterized damage-inducible protein DinB